MSKANPRTDREFIAVLDHANLPYRQCGSHRTYTLPDGRLLTLPCGHGGPGKELSTGLRCHLRKVLLSYGLLAAILIIGLPLLLRAIL